MGTGDNAQLLASASEYSTITGRFNLPEDSSESLSTRTAGTQVTLEVDEFSY
jgi:hypothetical protein